MPDSNQRSDESANRSRPDANAPTPSRNAAEWTTLVISFFVVAVMIGAAFYEHFGREEVAGTLITIDLAIDESVQRDDAYYVPFTVTNEGTDPAEDVTVAFEVMDGETVLEDSTVMVPFLANSGSADGQLVTSYDPARYTIEARPSTMLSP